METITAPKNQKTKNPYTERKVYLKKVEKKVWTLLPDKKSKITKYSITLS